MRMRFDDTARFVQAPAALRRELDGRAFVLDGATGDHFETNAIGGLIFRLAVAGRDVAAIRRELLATFAVEHATLSADLERYLGELVERGLLQVATELGPR